MKGYCYTNSPLYVERELIQNQDWDTSTINERRARLLEWAEKRWHVDLSITGDEQHELEFEEDEIDGDISIDAGEDDDENDS